MDISYTDTNSTGYPLGFFIKIHHLSHFQFYLSNCHFVDLHWMLKLVEIRLTCKWPRSAHETPSDGPMVGIATIAYTRQCPPQSASIPRGMVRPPRTHHPWLLNAAKLPNTFSKAMVSWPTILMLLSLLSSAPLPSIVFLGFGWELERA